MHSQFTDEPWQNYDIFDAAEQWGFTAKNGRNRTLGEGVYVKKNVFERFFITQDGFSYTIYNLKGARKPYKVIEQVLWPYELGVKIDQLLKK